MCLWQLFPFAISWEIGRSWSSTKCIERPCCTVALHSLVLRKCCLLVFRSWEMIMAGHGSMLSKNLRRWRGRNIMKKLYKTWKNTCHGEHHHVSLDTFMFWSPFRSCWFGIVWARWILVTRYMRAGQYDIFISDPSFYLNIHFRYSQTN